MPEAECPTHGCGWWARAATEERLDELYEQHVDNCNGNWKPPVEAFSGT